MPDVMSFFGPSVAQLVVFLTHLYSGDSVFHVHGNACKTLFNGLETQRFDHV